MAVLLDHHNVAETLPDTGGQDALYPAGCGDARKIFVAIFNVKYSPNLGDGIIAECLEAELRRCNPAIETRSIDLAGRSGFAAANGRSRGRVLMVLGLVPEPVRQFIVPLILRVLVRHSLAKRWRARLDGCDAAIIGGGALFADRDQNFPIKLAGAFDLCRERKLPVAIAHVGVTGGWSQAGKRRIMHAFAQNEIVSATVRDRDSIDNWDSEFSGSASPQPGLAPDPGLLSCDTYGRVSRLSGKAGPSRIAICATSPLVLRLHGGKSAASRAEVWMHEGISELLAGGAEVALFSNGSPEDEEFRAALGASFRDRPGFEMVPRFANPGELARFIAACDCVIAHRLHACIVAYSYRIPAIGLVWDKKLDAFFASVDRSRFVLDPGASDAARLSALVTEAIEAPPEPERHAQTLSACRSGISDLADQISALGQAA